ncbi:NTP transferase domain-containing protein [Candidatus Peregrinibacteria bacterium]|nr:NTP transferase domain-containing protein [Candidatus Peregrinibacteria bacterium]
MKGIVLAGGEGTRLSPLTKVTSKQLLPVYNKPMIFYPLETFIKAGISDILVITAPDRAGDFLRLLGSGKDLGVRFTYEIQDKPEGLAQAFLIAENFIGADNVAMILGDNIFEDDFLQEIRSFTSGAKIFAKKVTDPERFGVVEFDSDMNVLSIEEKPQRPRSFYAVTGLYIYDNSVVSKAKSLIPSSRNELEITDLNKIYLKEVTLRASVVHGHWLDTGTFESLFEANRVVRDLYIKNKL